MAAGIPDVDGDGLADLVFDDGDPLAGLPAALYANDVRGVGDLDGDGIFTRNSISSSPLSSGLSANPSGLG